MLNRHFLTSVTAKLRTAGRRPAAAAAALINNRTLICQLENVFYSEEALSGAAERLHERLDGEENKTDINRGKYR